MIDGKNQLDIAKLHKGNTVEYGDVTDYAPNLYNPFYNKSKPLSSQSNFKNNKWSINNHFKPYNFNSSEEGSNWNEVFKEVHKSIMLPDPDGYSLINKIKTLTVYYDRFKMPDPNLALLKGFPHVFFTRPNCNIFDSGKKLNSLLQSKDIFKYVYEYNKNLLFQLSKDGGGYGHDFMLSLSNLACSFSTSDEYITTGQYGQTYTGYKMTYGRHDIESKTAGQFTIEYNDTRNLDVYFLNRLWVQYIRGVFRGEIYPLQSSIMNKILDYAASLYYIITAEDGETILFWTKYYGVFPSQIPVTHLSWGKGQPISPSDFTIEYQYSFKEDCNPYAIMEFNHNSRLSGGDSNIAYAPIYNKYTNSASENWVGAPFISYDSKINRYKLRFKKMAEIGGTV